MSTERLTTEAQVRGAIERRLGRKVSGPFWALAKGQHYVSEALAETDAEGQARVLENTAMFLAQVEDAAAQASGRALRKGRRRPVQGGAGYPIELVWTIAHDSRRIAALGAHAAAEASEDPDVRRIRRAAAGAKEVLLAGLPLMGRPAVARATVALAAAGQAGAARVLRPTVRRLVDRYGWSEHDALLFVLFGGVPPAGEPAAWRFERGAHPLADRIVLSIHPAAKREDVLRLFERAMRGAPPVYRGRDLSPEDAARVAFVAEANDGRSWAEALEAWNRRHHKLRRKDSEHAWRTFSRDCRAAWQRVTGERLVWKGIAGPKRQGRAIRRGSQGTQKAVV